MTDKKLIQYLLSENTRLIGLLEGVIIPHARASSVGVPNPFLEDPKDVEAARKLFNAGSGAEEVE